jgi:hypothetical protein
MTRAFRTLVFACVFALASTAVNAKPRHKIASSVSQESVQCVSDNNGRTTCQGPAQRTSEFSGRSARYENGTVIGGRPAGCPRQYCGCGAMRYLGLTDKRLWRAWSWVQLFPRAQPAPGMAVVWKHHIALIESMVGPREAVLRDYNSGRGLSRIHVRSIAGAVVVDPRSRMAMR